MTEECIYRQWHFKSKKAGKSGLNNRIYQPFYGISKKYAEIYKKSKWGPGSPAGFV